MTFSTLPAHLANYQPIGHMYSLTQELSWSEISCIVVSPRCPTVSHHLVLFLDDFQIPNPGCTMSCLMILKSLVQRSSELLSVCVCSFLKLMMMRIEITKVTWIVSTRMCNNSTGILTLNTHAAKHSRHTVRAKLLSDLRVKSPHCGIWVLFLVCGQFLLSTREGNILEVVVFLCPIGKRGSVHKPPDPPSPGQDEPPLHPDRVNHTCPRQGDPPSPPLDRVNYSCPGQGDPPSPSPWQDEP